MTWVSESVCTIAPSKGWPTKFLRKIRYHMYIGGGLKWNARVNAFSSTMDFVFGIALLVGLTLYKLCSQQCCQQQRDIDFLLDWQSAVKVTIDQCCRFVYRFFLRSIIIIIGWLVFVVVSDGGVSVGAGGGGGGGCCCFFSDNCHCGSGSVNKRRSTLN